MKRYMVWALVGLAIESLMFLTEYSLTIWIVACMLPLLFAANLLLIWLFDGVNDELDKWTETDRNYYNNGW